MPALRTVLLAVVVAGAVSPAGASATVRIPFPRTLQAATYGAGQVVFAEHPGDGPIKVVAKPRSGVLAALPTFSADAEVSLAANAGGYLVAVRDGAREFIAQGGYDGSVRTLVDCRSHDPVGVDELAMAAGATGFAVAGVRCGMAASVDLVGPDGTVTPLPGVESADDPELSYAEPYLAVTIAADSDAGTVRVFNLADGTHRDLPAGYAGEFAPLAVSADGTVIVGPGGESKRRLGLYTWRPQAPRPLLVTTAAESLEPIFASSASVLFEPSRPVGGQLGLALAPVDGGALRPAGAPGIGAPRAAVGFDGTTAAIGSWSCDGELQATILEPPTPPGTYGCPVRVPGSSVADGTIGITCRNGCRTRLELHRRWSAAHQCSAYPTGGEIPSPTPVCETLGTVTLRLRPSARVQHVPLQLTSDGRSAHRRRARLPVELRFMTGLHPGPEPVGTPKRTLEF